MLDRIIIATSVRTTGCTLIDRRAMLAGLATLLAGSAQAQTPNPPAPSPIADTMRRLLDQFIAATEERFYQKERLASISLKSRAEALWPKLRQLESVHAAAPSLNALLAELRTSHTALFTQDDPEFHLLADFFSGSRRASDDWREPPPYPHLGFFTARIDGRHHVTHILEGTTAAEADLRVGDEVLRIAERAYAPVAALRNREDKLTPVVCRRRRGGDAHILMLPVKHISSSLSFDWAMAASARVLVRAGRRIGYIHIWHYRTFDALARALSEIDASRRIFYSHTGSIGTATGYPTLPLDALVVDARGKIGGHPQVAERFLNTLAGPRGGLIRLEGRRVISVAEAKSFKGRCALLIDANTRSAGELFAHGFKTEVLGPVFGSTTAGAVTSGQIDRLPGPMLLYLATSRVTIDGVDLEGVGVAPTHPVERPIPFSAGADPVLEAALDHLAGA